MKNKYPNDGVKEFQLTSEYIIHKFAKNHKKANLTEKTIRKNDINQKNSFVAKKQNLELMRAVK